MASGTSLPTRLAACLTAMALLAPCLGLAGEEAPELPLLRQNGLVFTQDSEAFPVHCLEIPDLLSQEPARQDELLDSALRAGFNSVSFEISFLGPQGLASRLGPPSNPEYLARLGRTLARLRDLQMYAFPVLWTAESARAFEQAVGGRPGYFFSFRRHQEWEYYFLKQLAALRDGSGGSPLATSVIGGWVLYSGALPAAEKEFRAWSLFAKRCLYVLGLKQLAGLSISPRPKQAVPDALGATLAGAAPAADLPPVPPALDINAFYLSLQQIPVPTQIDFFRVDLGQPVSLDQGRWLAAWVEAGEIEVPLIWRVDWSMLALEHRRAFISHKGLAGVSGLWPATDLPGNELWPPAPGHLHGTPRPVALSFIEMQAYLKGEKTVLHVRLNRPGTVKLFWGRSWPLTRTASSMDDALLHRLPLKGAKPGDMLLVRAWGDSEKWGKAFLRTSWVKVTKEEKDLFEQDLATKPMKKKRGARHQRESGKAAKAGQPKEAKKTEAPREAKKPKKAEGLSNEKRTRPPKHSSPKANAEQKKPVREEPVEDELPLSAPPPAPKHVKTPSAEAEPTAEPDLPEAEPVENVPEGQIPTE